MNHSSPHRLVAGGCGLVPGSVCPACGHGIAPDEKWCPSCDFTANRAIEWVQDKISAISDLCMVGDAAAGSETDCFEVTAPNSPNEREFIEIRQTYLSGYSGAQGIQTRRKAVADHN